MFSLILGCYILMHSGSARSIFCEPLLQRNMEKLMEVFILKESERHCSHSFLPEKAKCLVGDLENFFMP